MCRNFKHPHVLFILSVLVLLLVKTTISQLAATDGDVMNKQAIMCTDKERRALLGFKAMILSDPFDCVSTWGTKMEDVADENNCCSWEGVACSNEIGQECNGQGVTCINEKVHVVWLDLGMCGLEVISTGQNIHTVPVSSYARSSNLYDYVDQAMIQWQGIRREFTKNLRLLKSIDLSSNNLTGKIPNELTDLHGLLALNLSKNALFGEIPWEIGHMKELLILDLSRNNCSGAIPSSMSQMTSLNDLDVSYNNLSGRIPSSTQLRSFISSSYIGNAGLCGLPLSKYCPGDEKLPVPSPVGEREGGDEGDIDELDRWFYIGGATGFAIGFWIVCITLLVISRGRHTFFHFMDSLENRVAVMVLVFIAKFQKKIHE